MLKSKSARTFLIGIGMLAVAFVPGCAVRAGVGYRTYDPYYSDYHVWNGGEVGFYNQWTGETHRDSHRDFRKLNRNDQNEYWKWRHDHR